MASSSSLIAVLVIVGCAAAASAATFTVGDAQGWTLGSVDYTSWVKGKTFASGDKLVFNYPSKAHTVTEVSKSDYESCSSSNSLNSEDSGKTSFTLDGAAHYYICAIGTHCSNGMKLAIPAASGSSSDTPAGTPPSTNTPPSTPAASTPTGASARLMAGPVVAAAAAALVKLALF